MMAKSKAKSLPREADRKKIPIAVQHGLLMEAGYKCGNPTCRNVITLELHHIEYVSEGGGDEPENLLVLCPYCHAMHHANHIPVEAIRHWKGMLTALNQAFDRGSLDLLLFLWQTQAQGLWFSGDALLRFAGLVAAGLVTFNAQTLYGMTPTTSGFSGSLDIPTIFHGASYEIGLKVEIRLTDKGKRLVEAWRAGNANEYRSLISGTSASVADAPDSRAIHS
jgi:HNH endonuclease